MLYHLLYPLSSYWIGFNVFRYITFRTTYAALTGLLCSLILFPYFIRYFKRSGIGQSIKEYEPETHQNKKGTPTMGGIPILISIFISVFLWADLKNGFVWVFVICCILFGFIGFIDDYKKIVQGNGKGLSIKVKLLYQSLAALFLSVILLKKIGLSTELYVPFFKEFTPDLGKLYYIFIILVIVGASNAVNLTDGLDGLAIGPLAISVSAYLVLSYIAGNIKMAKYLQVAYIPGVGEITVVCGAVVGASLGFLWYNAYPAEVFMGDVGSLSLGAALGIVAVMIKQECLLVIIGGLFVIEACSVLAQIAYFRFTGGKRILKMAPLHHHFELMGWSEPKIIVRFWIIGIILTLAALSTLKLR